MVRHQNGFRNPRLKAAESAARSLCVCLKGVLDADTQIVDGARKLGRRSPYSVIEVERRLSMLLASLLVDISRQTGPRFGRLNYYNTPYRVATDWVEAESRHVEKQIAALYEDLDPAQDVAPETPAQAPSGLTPLT